MREELVLQFWIRNIVTQDWRGGRCALNNIIPLQSNVTKAVEKVMPKLRRKLLSMSYRVPVQDASLLDVTIRCKKEVTLEKIMKDFRQVEQQEMKNLMQIIQEPLVSSDIIGNRASCVIDATASQQIDSNTVRLVAWFDNEMAFAKRTTEMIVEVYKKMQMQLSAMKSAKRKRDKSH